MYIVATATSHRLLITSIAIGHRRRLQLGPPDPSAEVAEWRLLDTSDHRGGRGCLLYVRVCVCV
jgi:hypothetical protein